MPDLAERVVELEEEVAYLKGELGLVVDADRLGRLVAASQRVSESRRGFGQGGSWIALALYGAGNKGLPKTFLLDNMPRGEMTEGLSDTIVNVYIHKIRSIIGKDSIFTRYGGYAMTDVGRSKINELLRLDDERQKAAAELRQALIA